MQEWEERRSRADGRLVLVRPRSADGSRPGACCSREATARSFRSVESLKARSDLSTRTGCARFAHHVLQGLKQQASGRGVAVRGRVAAVKGGGRGRRRTYAVACALAAPCAARRKSQATRTPGPRWFVRPSTSMLRGALDGSLVTRTVSVPST